MASESVTKKRFVFPPLKRIDQPVGFCIIPADDDFRLLQVSEGAAEMFCENQASALESAVQAVLSDAVQHGMSEDLAFICAHALDTSTALRTALVHLDMKERRDERQG